MAGRAGPVATVQTASQRYQQGVQGAGQRWSVGVQGTQLNPMELAAAQQQRCAANFAARINDAGPQGWAARLRATPVAFWKSQCGAQAVQKYNMAKGMAKWTNWYQTNGQTMAMQMRAEATMQRAAGVPWQQRLISVLELAASSGRNAR